MPDEDERGRVLIVEDEAIYTEVYKDRLAHLYQIDMAMDVEAASHKLVQFLPDVVILDLRLQSQDSEDGLSFLSEIKEYNPEIKVIVVTVEGTTKTAMKAFQLGAYDFIEKKTQGYDELGFRVNQAYEKLRLERRIAELQRAEIERVGGYLYGTGQMIIGTSEEMKNLYERIDQVAPTNATVLILGKSGTGKELVAKAIHYHSLRCDHPIIPVNCTEIPPELIESELFGHIRGAFTGAITNKDGLFQAASGGTLFLDEIGELPPNLQVKLLRAIQEGEIRRIGDNTPAPVDCRLITATNKDLEQAVTRGEFREDLYYRLNVVSLKVPALRERKSDIPLLAKFFLDTKADKHRKSKTILGFGDDAINFLMSLPWPGNVRELENAIERAVVRDEDRWISEDDLDLNNHPTQDHPQTEEERILAYVKKNDSITNEQCRELLSVDKRRASYLLEKMCKAVLLRQRGERRWARYHL